MLEKEFTNRKYKPAKSKMLRGSLQAICPHPKGEQRDAVKRDAVTDVLRRDERERERAASSAELDGEKSEGRGFESRPRQKK